MYSEECIGLRLKPGGAPIFQWQMEKGEPQMSHRRIGQRYTDDSRKMAHRGQNNSFKEVAN